MVISHAVASSIWTHFRSAGFVYSARTGRSSRTVVSPFRQIYYCSSSDRCPRDRRQRCRPTFSPLCRPVSPRSTWPEPSPRCGPTSSNRSRARSRPRTWRAASPRSERRSSSTANRIARSPFERDPPLPTDPSPRCKRSSPHLSKRYFSPPDFSDNRSLPRFRRSPTAPCRPRTSFGSVAIRSDLCRYGTWRSPECSCDLWLPRSEA